MYLREINKKSVINESFLDKTPNDVVSSISSKFSRARPDNKVNNIKNINDFIKVVKTLSKKEIESLLHELQSKGGI